MSLVSYRSFRLIPSPFINIVKNYQTAEDGTRIGSLFSISLIGPIVAFKGSPDSTGAFWTLSGYPSDENIGPDSRLKAVLRKQEAIRDLFSVDGGSLEIQSADGSAPMKCNPRVKSITFPDELWFSTFRYQIELEADVVYMNGTALGEDDFTEYIESASESWSLDTNEDRPETIGVPRTYSLTHSISAKGKRFYDETGTLEKEAWQQARDWVSSRVGMDNSRLVATSGSNLPSYYNVYNHIRNENTDETNGQYSIVESWIATSGSAIEEFEVSTSRSTDNGIVEVNINGSVVGLEVRNPADMTLTTTKYTNALNKFNQVSGIWYGRAVAYSDVNLNVQPVTVTIGRNPILGTINYSVGYNNRASNYLTGALAENITLSNSYGIQVFAAVPVLGRSVGPVLQDIGTKQAKTTQLTIDAIFPIPSSITGGSTSDYTNMLFSQNPRFNSTIAASVQTLVNVCNPSTNQGATQVYVSNQSESWNPKSGSWNYTVEWVWE